MRVFVSAVPVCFALSFVQQHVLPHCDGHLLDFITELCLQQFFRMLFWILWKNENPAEVGLALDSIYY